MIAVLVPPKPLIGLLVLKSEIHRLRAQNPTNTSFSSSLAHGQTHSFHSIDDYLTFSSCFLCEFMPISSVDFEMCEDFI